ncbi:M48 family metallopeptidase [Halomonas urumqiensis]|uniref:Peptidase n=1 Tax=Halomonas urumqiensis TaxID=1684789 RepID=A0A2N7UMY9_9GAMM|nr:M48 family metallopeptidase [Halomonas urumqiensis]PMR81769.1 peptidase [Halomonas urumqiensis]PTB02406.1 M48 family peptidase [Halomonas urumqiensis]GHE21890.1 Zn-dependent protease [Halomonas urumqiensis]
MRWMHCIAIGALSITLAACTTSPTGRQQFTLYSDEQLNQMGQQAFAQYQQDLPTVGGTPHRYAECVASALVNTLSGEDRQQNWQIRVFESDEPNAFALPGGYMGINTGLLDIAENQDQLAAVIGHEIAHVLARHANERASTQSATQLGLSVLSSASGMQGAGGQQMMGVLGMGAQYGILLPFSRRHESEADVYGLEIMADAGFDPRASVALWQNMQAASDGARPPAWMSTHPSQGQRMSGLEANMDDAVARFQQARQAGRTPNCPRP